MQLDNTTLRSILVEGNYVSADDIDAVASGVGEDESLLEALLAADMVTPDLVGQAVAESMGVDYVDLNSNLPPKELVLRIPEGIAKKERLVLIKETQKQAIVATDEPTREDLIPGLKEVFKKPIKVVYALPSDIESVFSSYYRQGLNTRFTEIIEQGKAVAPSFLDEIFNDAISFEASDIHFEPYAETVRVRFRVDGVLQEAGDIPTEYYENILNRIKVMSSLRIDEHFVAQDGSLRYEKGERAYDMRTSVVPTLEGEKIVLRILASYIGNLTLDNLGLTPANQEIITRAAKNPFGMILATGPTGSGKTTILYSLLKLLSKPEVNIMTIEEPVEYKMRGVNQIQVDRDNGLSFANGLRSIVRQDPDIILVGEVRDEETAEIAVNAALTGHLMLSTFHSNDAATAIPRLLDMNAEPFLLASTLELIVGQRLIRTLCERCRYSIDMKRSELKEEHPDVAAYFKGKEVTLYDAKKCEACNYTGYDGRTAIFELIEITPEMETLILERPSTQEVWELARRQGSRSMFEDGLEKVKSGVTTIAELKRVAPSQYVRTKSKNKK